MAVLLLLASAATEAKAPYWPLATCAIGVCIGAILHHAYVAWEDRQ